MSYLRRREWGWWQVFRGEIATIGPAWHVRRMIEGGMDACTHEEADHDLAGMVEGHGVKMDGSMGAGMVLCRSKTALRRSKENGIVL